MSRVVLTAEIAYRDVTASPIATATAYLASEGFVTLPTDTLANQYFDGRLAGEGSHQIRLGTAFWGSGSSIGLGALEVINDDGGLDDWVDFEFRDRAVVVKLHTLGTSYNNATVLLNASVERVEPVDERRMRIVLRDPAADMAKPISSAVYDNTTDAEGILKPIAFGAPKMCRPVLVSANNLEYHVSDQDILGIDKVYDQGVVVDYVPVNRGFQLVANPAGAIRCNPITSGDGSAPILNQDGDSPQGFLISGAGRTMSDVAINYKMTDLNQSRASSDGGAWYFEITVDDATWQNISYDSLAWDHAVGIASAAIVNNQNPKDTGFYTLSGRTFISNAGTSPIETTAEYTAHNNDVSETPDSTAAAVTQGDVIGVVVDFDSSPMTITYYKNNTLFLGPYSIPAGTYTPVFGVTFGATSNPDTHGHENIITAAVVPDDLAYTPPASSSAWGTGITPDTDFDKLVTSITDRVPSLSFDASSVATINALAHSSPNVTYTYGYYLTDPTTPAEVLTRAMAGIGGYWFVNRLSKIQVGQLKLAGTSVRTITDVQITGGISIAPDHAPGLTDGIGANRNFQPYSDGEIAGSVTETFKQQITREYQDEYRTSVALAGAYEHALGAPLRSSLLINEVAAAAEEDRHAALFGGERKFWTVPIALEAVDFDEILDEIGDTYTIQSDRFGLDAGVKLVLVGVEGAFLDNEIRLILWGGGLDAEAEVTPTTWSYTTLTNAESSGDPWVTGDTIRITGGASNVDFLYFADLDVDGHSGLRHADPFNEGASLESSTLLSSEAANTDPDAWTGWIDASGGTKGVDHEFDINASRARIRVLTSGSTFAYLNGPVDPSVSDAKGFYIVDSVNTSGTGNTLGQIDLHVYNDGVNDHQARLSVVKSQAATNWAILDSGGTYYDTGIPFGTQSRLWIYCKAGKVSVWGDTDTSPTTHTSPRTPPTAQGVGRVGLLGDAAATDHVLQLGYHLHGNMS